MKSREDNLLKWELLRERFQIEDRFPPYKTRPELPISTIIKTIVDAEVAELNQLPLAIKERWPVLVGQQIAQHVTPDHLREDILYVHADHAGWLAEFRRLPKAPLLKKIGAIPATPSVRDIRCQLAPNIRTSPKK